MYYTNVAVLCCCLRMLENFIWRPRETRNTVNNKCEHGTRSFDAQQTHETLRGITFCVSSSLIIWLEGRKLRFFTSSQNCAESPAKLLSRLYIYLHYLHSTSTLDGARWQYFCYLKWSWNMVIFGRKINKHLIYI